MDQADCLLLNGNGKPVSLFPLSIISWKTAVKLFLTREVFLIKEYKDKIVRSPSFEMNLPSILMLPKFHHHAEQVKFCLLYTSPSPRDQRGSRMPSSA